MNPFEQTESQTLIWKLLLISHGVAVIAGIIVTASLAGWATEIQNIEVKDMNGDGIADFVVRKRMSFGEPSKPYYRSSRDSSEVKSLDVVKDDMSKTAEQYEKDRILEERAGFHRTR